MTPSNMTLATPHRIGLYLAAVQFFFTITWTVYVIFLPKLAAQAGIPKDWVIFILLADQMIFYHYTRSDRPPPGVRSGAKLTKDALCAVRGGFKHRIAARIRALQTSRPD